MKPEYFYLYLGTDAFAVNKLVAILCGTLPLTYAWRFNDPFDSKLGLDHSRKCIGLNLNGKSAVQDGFWSEEDFEALHQNRDELEMRDRYNVASFAEAPDSLLMWSHYADKHKGVCLKLKFLPERLPEGCFFKKVRYATHYPEIDVLKTEERSEVETFFLTKSVDWLYEKEWRLIAPSHMKENNGFDGQILSPFDVAGIYFGVFCEQLKFEDAVALAGCDMPAVTRMQKSKTDFRLEMKDD